jgi:hypothetical protein
LWFDQLRVLLFPERMVLARVSGGFPRRLLHKETVTLEPAPDGVPQWHPAVEAVGSKAEDGAFLLANVTLVLSNRFVRYVVVPWSDTLTTRDEELAFARHCFARVYGSDAEEWACKLSGAKPDKPRIACAVERPLIEALNVKLGALGKRYCSLQPHLMASFNCTRAQLGKGPAWLVLAEPGLLCIALLQDGCWQSVRTIRVGSQWTAELPEVLDREELFVDMHTECTRVLVFAPDEPGEVHPRAGKWRFEHLMPELLPGMIPGADAPYSLALGV